MENLVIVRGAGDIATGVIQKLHRAGFLVLALETAAPTAIRRTVSLCEAVRLGKMTVEDITAVLVSDGKEMNEAFEKGQVPLAIDPFGYCIDKLEPVCVVDAILAKRNLGTHLAMAPAVMGVGPGFTAGEDVHAVIETMRGHGLGRLILHGAALPNTGIPGELGGKSAERVIHAPCKGEIRSVKAIGDKVLAGETLFYVGDTPCVGPFAGLLRGLIAPGILVPKGMKVADVDPRLDVDFAAISDKARCIGGGVLEGVLYLLNRRRLC